MTDPRIHAAARPGASASGVTAVSAILLGGAWPAGLAAGVLAILHSSLFGARTVVIAGAVHTTRSQILDSERPRPRAAAHRRRHHGDGSGGSTGCPGCGGLRARRVALDRRRRRRRAVPVATSRLPGGGFALLDATGRVLERPGPRPRPCRSSSLPAVLGAAGQLSSALGADRCWRQQLRCRCRSCRGWTRSSAPPTGSCCDLSGGLTAVVGDDEALARSSSRSRPVLATGRL